MLEHLEKLCTLCGTSGNEKEVREYICSQIDGKVAYNIDNLGNIIAFKLGKHTIDKKIMVCAHMDEVGMIVTYINEDGTLMFSMVGGIDTSVVIGRQVLVGDRKTGGVVGSKAVHNLSADERKSAPKQDSLFIDIGAGSKQEAEKLVSLGDFAYFASEYVELGGNKIKSKAIDDRAGCAIMLDLIGKELEYDTYFVFNVQEEVGLRGARTSAFNVQPDFAIVLETTTASDIPSVSGNKRVCELGKGAVISYMDRATVYDRELYKLATETARENNIPYQTKTMIAGGNDSGAIHVSAYGVKTTAISAPCRYLHSPSCVAEIADIEACEKLTESLISRLATL